jgi:hypothetical protein
LYCDRYYHDRSFRRNRDTRDRIDDADRDATTASSAAMPIGRAVYPHDGCEPADIKLALISSGNAERALPDNWKASPVPDDLLPLASH